MWTDVGIAGNELFLSHRSYGFLEQIQQEVERLRRPRQRLLRLFTYFRAAAAHLSDKSLEAIEVAIDGRAIPGKAALVAIANVETYRGFLSLTPAASPVDGLFDICVIPRATPARVLGQLVKLMLGVPSCRKGISLYRGRHVRVNRRKPEDVRILERALPLLVPAGSLARLQARQTAAEAEVTFVTPAPPEPVASGRGPGGAPARPARSRRPVVVGGGG